MNFWKTLQSIAAASLLAVQLTAGPLPGPEMKAEIPFAFQVGGKTYAPGIYYVSASASKGMVAIKDDAGRTQMALAVSTDSSWDWSTSKITFVNKGGALRLSEVHVNTVVFQVLTGKTTNRPVEIALLRP